MLQRGHSIDLGLGRIEEDVAVSEGDRTGDDGESEIEQVGDRTDGAADHGARPASLGDVGLGGRTAGAGCDRRAARLCLEHAAGVTGKVEPVGFDHDVTDVPGVGCGTVEEAAVEHDPTADTGRHDHPEVVRHTDGGAPPPFGDGQGLGIVVDEHLEAGRRAQPFAQREVAPHTDVERGHALPASPHRTATTHAADDEIVGASDLVDERGDPIEQVVGASRVGGGHPGAPDDRTIGRDDPHLDLRAADVDGERSVHRPDDTAGD